MAGRVCPGNRPGALAASDCRVRAEPVESPLRNIHPVFGRLRHHGRLLQQDTRRSTSRRDAGGQTGGHTDARGCQGPRRGGGCVGATDHPRERAQMVCPGSAPSQPRIGSPTHSEALQWHRRRRARAQSAALLLVALARWLMNTIEAAPLAPRGRPETTPRPRTASASRRAATRAPTDDRSKAAPWRALHWAPPRARHGAAGGRRGLSEYTKGRLLTPAGQALATGGAAACTPPPTKNENALPSRKGYSAMIYASRAKQANNRAKLRSSSHRFLVSSCPGHCSAPV